MPSGLRVKHLGESVYMDLREKVYDWARWLTDKIKHPDRKVTFSGGFYACI